MKRLLALAAVLAAPALAQRAAPSGPSAGAADRYHEAARLYVDGQNAPALAAAEAAVALDPGDARAVALRDLLKQKQDPQTPDPPPDDSGGGENPPPPDDGGEKDPGPDEPNGPGETPPSPGESPPSPNEMSPEQAERLLDAVGGDERLLLRQMRRPPSRVRTNDQDW